MDFSIIVPGDCDAKCGFCFWKQTEACDNYITKVESIISELPDGHLSLKLTGGEPTLSPYLKDLLQLIKKYKSKFKDVTLLTNGSNLYDVIDDLGDIVDHVSISIHHFNTFINERIMNRRYTTTNGLLMNRRYSTAGELLIRTNSKLNSLGIDVTFTAVLIDQFNDHGDILEYIEFGKSHGASSICFKKIKTTEMTLDPTTEENLFNNTKPIYIKSDTVSRVKIQLINGMKVIWKTSLLEPSNSFDWFIYELILHPNGHLTRDWESKRDFDIIKSEMAHISSSVLTRAEFNQVFRVSTCKQCGDVLEVLDGTIKTNHVLKCNRCNIVYNREFYPPVVY